MSNCIYIHGDKNMAIFQYQEHFLLRSEHFELLWRLQLPLLYNPHLLNLISTNNITTFKSIAHTHTYIFLNPNFIYCTFKIIYI